MLGYDDRVEAPAGVTPAVEDGAHPVLADTPGDWPYFLGYNRLVADGGHTVLSFGSDPLLVVDERGSRRCAAFASDCSPHWGSPDFMAWEGYGPFWNGLLQWLSGAERPAGS